MTFVRLCAPVPVVVPLVVAVFAVLGSWGSASADVPKPEDITACNQQAHEAVKAGSASPKTAAPNTKDERRAAEARRGDAPAAPQGAPARSEDPQLEGMDAEGAKDPVYQAAYRSCMRKSGF
jgi:hypothetical protein